MGAALGLLVLGLTTGCQSPRDLGFEAAAKFTAPLLAIGAETKTMPCDERMTMFEEFVGEEDLRKKRLELGKKVLDSIEKDGFDEGFEELSGVFEEVFSAFGRDCPAQAPKARELAWAAAKELHIESKVAWLAEK